MTTIAEPTLRFRWQMYARCLRIAAKCRAGLCHLPVIDAESAERAARAWALPFEHRLPKGGA